MQTNSDSSSPDFANLLDLDLPKIPPLPVAYTLMGECLAGIAAATTVADLQTLAGDYNTTGSVFSALCDADKLTARLAWRARQSLVNLSVLWRDLWSPLRTMTQIAAEPPPVVAVATEAETIETTLTAIVQSSVRAATRNSRATATRVANTVQAIIADGAILAKAVQTVGDGAELRHGYAIVNHLTRRGDLITTLAGIGMTALAPKAPSGVKHLGEAMQRLNNNSLIARRASEDPKGVDARWFVGAIDHDCKSGSLGDRDLIVDLKDGALEFTPATCSVEINGDTVDVVATVQAAFERRIAGETYNSTTMLAWLKHTLEKSFYARACYDTVYVGAGQVENARKLVDALDVSGCMGRRMVGLVTMPSDRGLRAGLLCGFAGEIEAIEREIDLGKTSPITLIQDLYRYQKAVDGFEALIGETAVSDLKVKIAALHVTCSSRLDYTGGEARAAVLEMD